MNHRNIACNLSQSKYIKFHIASTDIYFFSMVQCEVLQAGVNILTFIPLLHLIPEGGMSPLPVRKDSGGKAIAMELCVYLPTLL